MAKDINFGAIRATVTISSEKDPRWSYRTSKIGSTPPDQFSLRGDLVNNGSNKLYELQETFGAPPDDLVFLIEEEWSIGAITDKT